MIWRSLFPKVVQRQIQIEEGTYIKAEFRPMKLTKGNVYGALGGSIFGSLCWLFLLAYLTKDWFVAFSVLIFAVILFTVSTKMCLRASDKYWRIVIIDMMSIALLTFVVVNLRWGAWKKFYRESPSGFDMPLWGMNLIVLAVFLILLVILIMRARTEKFLCEKPQQKA